MSLQSCGVCGRRYSALRPKCPYCGGVPQEKASVTNVHKAMGALLFLLVALNVWGGILTERGPDPVLEAFHSPGEAGVICQQAMSERLSSLRFSLTAPVTVDYLQGGEYDVFGQASLTVDGRRGSHTVRCEVQFSDGEWVVEDIAIDPAN